MASASDPAFENLTEDVCWNLLATKQLGRLAVSISNQPDIFPVNYRLDDETIVVKSAAGLKLYAATLGEAVAFEVDALDELRQTGWSVVVRGPAFEIERSAELVEAGKLLLEPWAGGERNRYFRITPTQVTGRRITSVVTR